MLLAALIALAGCGKSGGVKDASHNGSAVTQGAGVPASAVAVISGWADALRTGHPQRAAAYWALPSVLINGTTASGQLAAIAIRSRHQALEADETLPCGATLKATALDRRYVRARFQLGSRKGVAPSASCSGLAEVDFLIVHGHIERWLRAATGTGPASGARTAALERQSPAAPLDVATAADGSTA